MNTDYIIQYEHKKSGKTHFRVVPSVSSLQSAEQCFRDDFDYLDKFNLISVTPSGESCYSEVRYPYEIHITIRDYPESAEAFRKTCEAAGVKPLLIALQDASLNLVQHDIMTKCDVKGTLQEAVDTAIGDVLKPASWKAPAKHARGNIFDDKNGLGSMGPYGPAYLR